MKFLIALFLAREKNIDGLGSKIRAAANKCVLNVTFVTEGMASWNQNHLKALALSLKSGLATW